MKKLFIISGLLIWGISNAQALRFNESESTNITISVDPGGSIKEGGLNFSGDLEHVSGWKYVKIGFQSFGALKGGYLDVAGGMGINLTRGYFDQVRFYSGIRLGHIRRGSNGYPLFGTEAGINYKVSKKVSIGVSGLYDYRSDFKYSGANEDWQFSGRFKALFDL